MLRRYLIISVKDFGIVIDNLGQCDEIGSVVYARQYGLVSRITEKLGGSSREILLEEMPHNGTLDRRQLDKVIATVGKRIEGVPLIEYSTFIDDAYFALRQLTVKQQRVRGKCLFRDTFKAEHLFIRE